MASFFGFLAVGLVFLAVGLPLVTDFRGGARWYTAVSLRFARPVTALRRRETPRARAEREAFALLTVRIVGGLFAAIGAVGVCLALADLLVRL